MSEEKTFPRRMETYVPCTSSRRTNQSHSNLGAPTGHSEHSTRRGAAKTSLWGREQGHAHTRAGSSLQGPQTDTVGACRADRAKPPLSSPVVEPSALASGVCLALGVRLLSSGDNFNGSTSRSIVTQMSVSSPTLRCVAWPAEKEDNIHLAMFLFPCGSTEAAKKEPQITKLSDTTQTARTTA